MTASSFVYVTYIRTTQERLWQALTKPEIMKQYWFGMHQDSDWQEGSPWRLVFADGRVADQGRILEIEPPKRVVIEWRHEITPELRGEGPSRCTMELEPWDDVVKLTITHTMDRPQSELIGKVSGGWPKILSNLKSWLETGEVLAREPWYPAPTPHREK